MIKYQNFSLLLISNNFINRIAVNIYRDPKRLQVKYQQGTFELFTHDDDVVVEMYV